MVSSPAVTPVTTPVDELTVAFPLLALHTPLGVALDKVVVDPTHVLSLPVIVPPEGVDEDVTL